MLKLTRLDFFEPSTLTFTRDEALELLRNYIIFKDPGNLFLDLAHCSSLIILVILLHRTAAGLKGSRFLRHIAHSFLINAGYYMGRVLVVLLRWSIASNALSVAAVSNDSGSISGDPGSLLTEAAAFIVKLNANWEALDVVLSLFSSFWLLIAWFLLRGYPQEGVSRRVYSLAVGTLASLLGMVFAIATAFPLDSTQFLVTMDVLLASLAIGLLGLELYKRLKPISGWFDWPLVTGVAYGLWSLLQLPYVYYVWTTPEGQRLQLPEQYLWSLLLSKFVVGVLTIILATHSLPERPGYEG